MPQPFQYIPLSIIEPISPQKLIQGGALFGQVPTWNGFQYAPQNPVSAFNNGTSLGRISEINVTGSATAAVVGNRMNISVLSGSVSVNNQVVTQIYTGTNMNATFSPGIAVLNATIPSGGGGVNLANGFGTGLVVSPGTSSAHTIKGLLAGPNTVIEDFSSYLRITANTIAAISINGLGNYSDIQIGSGLQAVGNVISAIPSTPTTLTHSGFGSTLFTGSAPNYTLKGLRSLSSGLTISDTGSTLDFTLTGGSTGGVNVWNNGNPIGVVQNINFVGFPSVINGGNLAVVTAPSGGGTFGVNVNGSGPFGNLTFSGAGVSVSGSTITIPGASGGGSTGINILNNSSFFAANVSTLDIWNAASLQNLGGGLVRLVLPSGGGSGITGIQVNNAGNYQNINFSGAGVSVSGNNVTVFGSSSGLTGITANGLVIGTNTVQLNLANFSSPGAMPAFSGLATDYFAGDGIWRPVPSGGGGGAVNSVSSGAPSVLSVSPSSGNVVITPIGFSGTFTPFLSGTTLAVPNHTLTNGITTSLGTTFINLPTASFSLQNGLNTTAVNLGGGAWRVDASGGTSLPLGNANDTFRNNGTGWEATNSIRVFPNGNVTFGSNARGIIDNANTTMYFGENAGTLSSRTFSVILHTSGALFNTPRPNSFYVGGGNPVDITFEVGTSSRTIGFFGATPVTRPATTNDITSVRNALIALGLIQ